MQNKQEVTDFHIPASMKNLLSVMLKNNGLSGGNSF